MRSGFGIMGVVVAIVSGVGCGWLDAPAPPPAAEPAPAPATPAPELGPSLGTTAMPGLIGEVDGGPVITSCDGMERVRVTPADETADQLIALSKEAGPTFVVLRGDRHQRTIEDVKTGLDGTLAGAVVLQGRPAADGDCGVPDLASNPQLQVPRDGAVAFSGLEALAVKATWKLAAEVPERPGMGRLAEDAIEARLLELTLGWCDGATSVRIDGFNVEWEVTSASDEFLGAWRVSCGRARNAVLRTGKSAAMPYALMLDGKPTSFNVPLLGLDHPDRALAFGAWTLGLKPGCAGTRCPEGMTPPPPSDGKRPTLVLKPPPGPATEPPKPQ